VRIVAALASALERLLHDPGREPARLKTGSVIVEFAEARERKLESVVAASLPAPRFTGPNDPERPTDNRRRVNAFVEEVWTAIPFAFEDLSTADLAAAVANGVVPIMGYEVRQVVSHRESWVSMNAEQRQEVLQSIGQYHRHEDHVYNGHYPTIRGHDVAHHDPNAVGMAAYQGGNVLRGRPAYDASGKMVHDGTVRGGTEIRGGRAEYRRVLKQKGYEPFDKGYFAHVDRIKADQQAARDAKHKIAQEKADAMLPRKLGEL